MIEKIIIDNFMAHEHTEMELGPGVTILTGANNTGKSAVVEALRCLATNPTPSHCIRHGAKEARVTVELDNGIRVVWVRTKRWAKYELWRPGAEEPEEYHKLQRRVPEDIAEVLKLDLVELENSKDPVDIHIGNQREPIFLLNRPDSAMAAFFAASTESAHLLAMQNVLKRRTQDAKREERGLEEQAVRIRSEMDTLAPLPDITVQLEAVRDLEAEAIRLQVEIPALESVLAEQRNLAATLQRTKGAGAVLATTPAPPELAEVRPLRDAIRAMSSVGGELNGAYGAATALAPLAEPPATADAVSLLRLTESLAETGAVLRKAAQQHAALAGLVEPPARETARELAVFLDDFIAVHYRRVRLARWETCLRKVAEPPQPQPVGPLAETVAALARLRDGIAERKAERDRLENDLRKIVDAMDERVAELGCCPTCGGELTTAAFLEHGGRHGA